MINDKLCVQAVTEIYHFPFIISHLPLISNEASFGFGEWSGGKISSARDSLGATLYGADGNIFNERDCRGAP